MNVTEARVRARVCFYLLLFTLSRSQLVGLSYILYFLTHAPSSHQEAHSYKSEPHLFSLYLFTSFEQRTLHKNSLLYNFFFYF